MRFWTFRGVLRRHQTDRLSSQKWNEGEEEKGVTVRVLSRTGSLEFPSNGRERGDLASTSEEPEIITSENTTIAVRV